MPAPLAHFPRETPYRLKWCRCGEKATAEGTARHMAEIKTHLSDGSGELNESARRILNLLFVLNCSTRPLTTTEIITDSDLGYGAAGVESEKKKFQRDRKKLEDYGIHIREVKESGASETEESRWEIDRGRTHIDTAVITQNDADMLVHAVDEYLKREIISFRSALLRIRAVAAAIDTDIEEGEDAVGEQFDDQAQNVLDMVWTACCSHKSLPFCYRDSKGEESKRTVSIYGIFNQANQCYFVGLDNLSNSIRTFRTDRIVSVNRPRGSYTVPDDFSLDSFQFLPFDLGNEEETPVEFSFPAHAVEEEIKVLTLGRGMLKQQADGSLHWKITVKNLAAAASMALANASLGMRPCAPASLVSLWNSMITEAVEPHGRI